MSDPDDGFDEVQIIDIEYPYLAITVVLVVVSCLRFDLFIVLLFYFKDGRFIHISSHRCLFECTQI